MEGGTFCRPCLKYIFISGDAEVLDVEESLSYLGQYGTLNRLFYVRQRIYKRESKHWFKFPLKMYVSCSMWDFLMILIYTII